MKVNIELNGKTAEIDIPDEKLVELGLVEKNKPTGYERVKDFGQEYYYVTREDMIEKTSDLKNITDNIIYESGNHYSSRDVAVANARADRLMRRLRRFAAENGGIPSVEDWTDGDIKFAIHCTYDPRVRNGIDFTCSHSVTHRDPFQIYFNSKEACRKAIEEFKGELTWYFNKYQAMLY